MEQHEQQQTAKGFLLMSSSGALRRSETCPVYDDRAAELIIYTGDTLDTAAGEKLFLRLISAFPKMTETTAKLIIERMAENGFTQSRAIDALNNVIDTYQGWDKVPSVANFIQFNKRVKLLTWHELTVAAQDGRARWADYSIIRIEGVSACRSAGKKPALYASIADVERYGLTTREPKASFEDWPD